MTATPPIKKANTSFDKTILRLYRNGRKTSEIADYIAMSIYFVRTRLLAHGIDMSVPHHEHRMSEVWSLDEDQRREAFRRHAANAARETRLKGEGTFKSLGEALDGVLK